MDRPLSVFILFTFLGCLTVDGYTYKELFFDQVIDHFNFYSENVATETYKQRYLVQGKLLVHVTSWKCE